MSTDVVNLTPHGLHLIGVDGHWVNLASDGRARVRSREEVVESVAVVGDDTSTPEGIAVPLYVVVQRQVVGIPPPKAGTLYVVSGIVAQHANRSDVVAPMRLLRAEGGAVEGVRGLMRYS